MPCNIESAYFLEDEFNTMTMNTNITSKFSVIHVNARSLPKNIYALNIYLNTLSHSFSVIAVSETWATADSETLLLLSGYVGIFKNRPKSRGDGVAVL